MRPLFLMIALLCFCKAVIADESASQYVEGVFSFNLERKQSYKISSGSDLNSWSHLVSVRGEDVFNYSIPPSELTYSQRFFRAEKVSPIGGEWLTEWRAFQSAKEGSFSIGLIGDSYTYPSSRYSKRLKRLLAYQYGNLGAGYMSFGFHPRLYKSASVDEAELDYVLDYSEWSTQYGNGYGPDACHAISKVNGAKITVKVKKSIDSLRVMYANVPGTGGFRYRFGGGAWVTVSTDAALSLGVEEIGVQDMEAPYDLEIEALSTDVTLIGAEAVKQGDGVMVHKLAVSGGRASHFANNDLAKASMAELDLDMALIMFGTNEHAGSQSPESYRANLVNIVNVLRAHNENIDLVFVLPCYTKFENEVVTGYSLQDYGQVMRSLAVEYHGAFMDLTEVFGPAQELQNLIDSGLMHSDRVHPTTTAPTGGGYLIADTIYKSVLSCPWSDLW